jgi:hypothetical protein
MLAFSRPPNPRPPPKGRGENLISPICVSPSRTSALNSIKLSPLPFGGAQRVPLLLLDTVLLTVNFFSRREDFGENNKDQDTKESGGQKFKTEETKSIGAVSFSLLLLAFLVSCCSRRVRRRRPHSTL